MKDEDPDSTRQPSEGSEGVPLAKRVEEAQKVTARLRQLDSRASNLKDMKPWLLRWSQDRADMKRAYEKRVCRSD